MSASDRVAAGDEAGDDEEEEEAAEEVPPAVPLYLVVTVCRDAAADELYAAEHPESGTVAVVQQYEVPGARRFLTLGRAIIGAQYVEEEFRGARATPVTTNDTKANLLLMPC